MKRGEGPTQNYNPYTLDAAVEAAVKGVGPSFGSAVTLS